VCSSDLMEAHKPSADFRQYEKDGSNINETYRLNHTKQTVEFVTRMEKKYTAFNSAKMDIWTSVDILSNFLDESDPDANFPQIYHAFQTAESLRKRFPEDDWFHLVGLLHDLGKVLFLESFGSLPQWAVVGDTFPVGCSHSKSIVYSEYFTDNPDSQESHYNTKYGIYEPNCGLNKLKMSWGHDEYMYQMLLHNKCTLPKHGLDIIRYHSFYAWHTNGDYKHLMSKEDEETLMWVERFNKSDLYSKSLDIHSDADIIILKKYYQTLIEKYIPKATLEW